MKTKIIVLILFCFINVSCEKSPHQSDILNRIFDKYNLEMKAEFSMIALQHSVTTDPKIRKIAVDFYEHSEVEVLQARYLIHRAAHNLLGRLNQCSYIRSVLGHYPFTENDIEVTISFIDPKSHKRYSHGCLAHATLSGGKIYYSTYSLETEQLSATHVEEFVAQR